MIVIAIILTAINVLIAGVSWYRLCRQSMFAYLLERYERTCRLNECDQIIIKSLQNRLKEYEKEEGHE